MKVAIMQPYFLPYIGYLQLIASVDKFIVYDNIKYTKKGWVNRNRMLLNGREAFFTLPLKKDSDFLDVVDRELSLDFDRSKLLNQFKGAYIRAPYFSQTFPLLERIISFEDANLFRYIHNSLIQICKYLGITTEIRISSDIHIDHELKSVEKVIALCQEICADTYINAIGGIGLYDKSVFNTHGLDLRFIRTRPFEYVQFATPFVPWLSIVDVLMFNPVEEVSRIVRNEFDLI